MINTTVRGMPVLAFAFDGSGIVAGMAYAKEAVAHPGTRSFLVLESVRPGITRAELEALAETKAEIWWLG